MFGGRQISSSAPYLRIEKADNVRIVAYLKSSALCKTLHRTLYHADALVGGRCPHLPLIRESKRLIMFESLKISNLPPFAKLFVGLFTTLMLCVCAWTILILYVQEGMISEEEVPAYVTEPYGEAEPAEGPEDETENGLSSEQFEHNVKLAHTHINGQTLLFFAIGLVFLFTSVKPKIKIATLWVFAVSVFVHAFGLAGQHFYWFYDDILAISGFLILGSIAYMSFVIYVNLLEKPALKK